MSDRKGKQPVSSHRPSQLRNEIIPDSSDNERVVNESVVQVPDSDTVVLETQYDPQPAYIPNGSEHDRGNIWRQSSEQPNTADEALLSRCGLSKKTGLTVDSTFVVKQLERPKEVQGTAFSFASPSFVTRPARQVPLTLGTHENATFTPKPSASTTQSTASRHVDGISANEPKELEQFPEMSVVHSNNPVHQGSQAVQASFVPLEIDTTAASGVDPASAAFKQPVGDLITEHHPAQNDRPAEGLRSERRAKGKKTKKGRKSKLRPTDATAMVATAAWPLDSQHHDLATSEHTPTTKKDQVCPESQEKQASIPRDEYAMAEESPQSHHSAAAPIALHNARNDHETSQSQDYSMTILPVEAMEATPGQTPLRPNDKTMSFEPQNSPPAHAVSSGHDGDTENGSGHHDTRCVSKSQTVARRHLEAENRTVMHETSGNEGIQPVWHDHDSITEATLNFKEAHGPTSDIQDLAQPEASAARASPSHSQAQSNVSEAHNGSNHLSQPQQVHDSMLHEKMGRDSSNRVSKLRTKKRTKGPSTPPDLRNLDHGTTLPTSPDNEVILNMMAMCLRAGDTKARNIVDTNAKAHDDAVASLRETIGQQNNFIQNLQARNDGLHGRVQKLSESTTQLQKYVKGMEGDYARLKSQAEAHRKTCDRLVRDSIHEPEQERSVLKREFVKTVDALSSSQRHMRAAMNDCFSQLMSSENKYLAVSKQLHKLTADYDEEKKKSLNFEQQILPAVQAIQASLDENQTVILEKVGKVQRSLDDTSAEKERDVRLKECLDALRSLQANPALTIHDVRKAEAMLRFIHESIGSKMSDITRSVEKIQDPTEDIRAYIGDQLATLREDVLRNEDVSEECQKTQQSKEHFLQQLEVQKEQCAKLEGAIRSSRQQEADAKARCSFLESELEAWKGKSCNHDSDSAQIEEEAGNLRQQLEKAREDLRGELTELGRVQQRLEDQAMEMSIIKATLDEKEASYQVYINKITQERAAKIGLLRESQIEKDKLAGDLSHAESKIRELASEAEKVRGANIHMKKDLQKAQSAAQEASSLAPELADLKRRLTEKSDEAQSATDEAALMSSQLITLKQRMAQASEAQRSKEEDLKNTQAELTRLVNEAADLSREKHQIKNQLNEHVSTIADLKEKIGTAHRAQEKSAASVKQLQSSTEVMRKDKDQLALQISAEQSKVKTLRKEMDARENTRRKDMDALDSLQHRLENLHEEKQELEFKLGRSRATEIKLSEAQAVYSSEKEGLQLELAKLQASLEVKNDELRRTKADYIEKSKKAEEDYAGRSNELKRRISQTETALKAAEKTAEHKSRELEAHKEATLKKFELLVQEAQNQESFRQGIHRKPQHELFVRDPRLQESSSMHAVGSQPQRPHSVADVGACHEEPFETRVTKARKKPNRGNLTVLNVADSSHTQSTPLLRLPNAVLDVHHDAEEGNAHRGFIHAAVTNEFGAREMLDENGISSIEPAGDESQEPQRALVCSAGAFDHSMKAMTRPRTAETSSSVLSDPLSSDDLIDMDPLEQGTVPVSLGNGYGRFKLEEGPRGDQYHGTPHRSSRHSLHGASSLPQDRPKSQANTGSRMLPPATPTVSSTKNYRSPANAGLRIPAKSARTGDEAQFGNTVSSSPDYVHRPVSNQKTYGNYSNPSAESLAGTPSRISRPSVHSPTKKRKGPGGGASENAPSKRLRASPRVSSSQSTLSSQPAQISQIQSQSPCIMPNPRTRRSKGRRRSDEFDAMFDRELQTGPSRRPR
ncbi:uncharacterized protein N0V89_008160 [Didymosphaeria variabile]|uniref:Uncharacterized protein n=1 Tax=Didymosphaeria variabile TaxID=1932322 RepID=A0A9W8XH32_9PLEO|nr:uncharacterized protein N0V89_008160 [Didymosphaeria variabile]KAJ4349544.1 hypothetical protein N0V89_008160 [Didymosphaeria variabile]